MMPSNRKNHTDQDQLALAMQTEAIRIREERLGLPLPDELAAKVRQSKWSYTGMEMIIDTVRAVGEAEIEPYLSKLN